MTPVTDKPPLQLRVAVTDRCQLRCRYCMPEEGIALRPCAEILRFEEIAALVGHLQSAFTIDKIRLTGGDPLVRPELPVLVRMLADLGIPQLALTTNGQRLAALAAPLEAAGLDRVNISLDSLDPAVFRDITRGGDLQQTLDGIAAVLQTGMRPVKLNTVVMRGINDGELDRLLDFALANGCELRFLELMPIGHGAGMHQHQFVSADAVRQALAAHVRLSPLPREAGASAQRTRVCSIDGRREGIVGFIAPCSAPFCADCTRLRLTSDGRLMGCLAREDGGSQIRPLLQAGDTQALLAAARQALHGKRTTADFAQSASMAAIGG